MIVPSVLLMRWPFIVMKPWAEICRGSGSFAPSASPARSRRETA
jgi:hypothetical protein